MHLDDLLKPYRQYGHLHYGEGVTELAHALQAAQLASVVGEKNSSPEEESTMEQADREICRTLRCVEAFITTR